VATAVFPSPSSSTNSIAFESSPRRGVHSARTCLAPRLLTLLWRLVFLVGGVAPSSQYSGAVPHQPIFVVVIIRRRET
jgi:hypothetical protein